MPERTITSSGISKWMGAGVINIFNIYIIKNLMK